MIRNLAVSACLTFTLQSSAIEVLYSTPCTGETRILDSKLLADGSLVIAGWHYGTLTLGENNYIAPPSNNRLFVAKFDPSGQLMFSASCTGSLGSSIRGMDVDDHGDIYVCGEFGASGSGGSLQLGALTITRNRETDIFVAKLSPAGTWVWAKAVNTTAWSGGYGLTLTPSGELYVCGYFYGTTSFGSTSLTSVGWYDGFVAKLSPVNGDWIWARKFGSTSGDGAVCLANLGTNQVVVLGDFKGTITLGTDTLTSKGGGDLNGHGDLLVGCLDSDGNWLWATRAGGTDKDRGWAMETTDAGDIYVTGYFTGIADFGSTTIQGETGPEGFLSKLGQDGEWLWVRTVLGPGEQIGWGVCSGPGNTILASVSSEANATAGTLPLNHSEGVDTFCLKYGEDGGLLTSQISNGPGAQYLRQMQKMPDSRHHFLLHDFDTQVTIHGRQIVAMPQNGFSISRGTFDPVISSATNSSGHIALDLANLTLDAEAHLISSEDLDPLTPAVNMATFTNHGVFTNINIAATNQTNSSCYWIEETQ